MEKHVYFSGKRGFTLIELMVVVAIIGILMATGIVMFSDAQKVARDAKRRADVDAIGKAMEQYYQNRGYYYYVGVDSNTPAWDDAGRRASLGIYFSSGSLPFDPVNDATFRYFLRGIDANRSGAVNPQSRFCTWARLEQGKGNCTGITSTTLSDPNSYQCAFVTPDTGTHYCVQNRQ